MKIIISGYGRMGREVEKAAIEKGHTIVAKLDKPEDWSKFDYLNNEADVVIDFSLPESAVSVYQNCFELNIPVVTGTTGWYDQLDEVTESCKKHEGAIFYAPNFSIGVNIFFLVNNMLSKTMSSFDDYQVSIHETHHIHKLDAPSGTAIKLAEDIIENHKALKEWVTTPEYGTGKIPVISIREGEVPGTHTIQYNSDADLIEIKHEAINRSGFAKGAVAAAEWLIGKKGVYTMNDMLKDLL